MSGERASLLAAPVPEPDVLYAMDDAQVMFPHEWCATASKAKYRGWKELNDVGMVDSPFYPPCTTAHVAWMFRFTADPWAEMTHAFGDPMTPGAYKVWVVEVDPAW